MLGLLAAERCAAVLSTLAYEITLWLDLAARYCGDSPEVLTRVLHDVGIHTAVDLGQYANDIQGPFRSIDVILPILDASSAIEQAELLMNGAGRELLREIILSSPFEFLCALVDDSTLVLDLMLSSDEICCWFMEDAATVSSLILDIWMTPGEWLAMMGEAQPGTFLDLFGTGSDAWVSALIPLLQADGPTYHTVLDPSTDLGCIVINSIAAADPTAAATVCRSVGIEPIDSMTLAAFEGWLSIDVAAILLDGTAIEKQVAVATDPLIVGVAQTLGYIDEVLPELAANAAALADASTQSEDLNGWLLIDVARFHTLASAQPVVWIDALIGGSRVQLLFALALHDAPFWRGKVDDAKYQAVLGTLQKPCAEDETAGIWALWTDANRSVAAGLDTFHTITGLRLWTSSQQPEYALPDWTSSAGVVFERKLIWTTVDPDQTTLNTYLSQIRAIPRGLLTAAGVGFGKAYTYHFKKKSPDPPDATWGTTMAPIVRTSNTSLTWSDYRFIMMATTAAGAIGPSVSGFKRIVSDGNASGVGGQRNQQDATGADVLDASGNPVRENTTDTQLTYFQNHCTHENGHAVGARQYSGTNASGDDTAKIWAKWEDSTADEMKGAYFAGATGTVADVKDPTGADHAVPAADIGTWLTTVVSTGNEPAGNGVTTAFAGTPEQHLTGILQSSVGGQLPQYVNAVKGSGSVSDIPGKAFRYPGFVPSGAKTYIYCHTFRAFKKYITAAGAEFMRSHGWYGLTDHREMFAEIYAKYFNTAAHATPTTRNGIDWTTFFTALIGSPDVALQEGVTPTVTGVGGAPGPAGPTPGLSADSQTGSGSTTPASGNVQLSLADIEAMITEGVCQPTSF
ncbi:MAG: hypothetical protein JW797_20605 [Bradymonadales bacterium]|nr:hypothetical protein [Bradymonadales bacterium]